MLDFGQALFEVGAFCAQVSGFLAVEAESLLYAFLTFFSNEFADFDNVDIHAIGVLSLDGVGEGLVGLMSRFRVPLGDFIGVFPLGLERNGFLIPAVDGGGNSVHGHNAAHEGGRDASREISNEDVLVGDACKGGVVLEVRYVLDEGWGVGVVLPLGHALVKSQAMALPVVSWCLNAVSNFVTKLEKVPMVMVVSEMVYCLNVVAQVRADLLVM